MRVQIQGTGKIIKKYILGLLKSQISVSKITYGHSYTLEGKVVKKINTQWLIVGLGGVELLQKMNAPIISINDSHVK